MSETEYSPEAEKETAKEIMTRLLAVETAELTEIRRSAEYDMDIETVREIRGKYQDGCEQLECDYNDRIICQMAGSALILIRCDDPENNLWSDIEDLVNYLDQISRTDEADALWKYLRGEEVESESF